MNPIFLLDPPPIQSVSQRQSQKKAATQGVGSYLLSTSPSQRHWNNYYGGGFYRIYTHSVSKRQFTSSFTITYSGRSPFSCCLACISAAFILALLELWEPSKLLFSAATFWPYFILKLCIISTLFENDATHKRFGVNRVANTVIFRELL